MQQSQIRLVLESIAANIRLRRDALQITQEELAYRTRLHINQIQNVELAKSNPTITTLLILAEALETNLGALLRKRKFTKPQRGRPINQKKASP
ncbi:MAG: helix-turn-helix transcriptional regulator [Deltaproteobacteria bacterium]|nr:helix-turn-helix transcriptional regulator [Deltaproteobacteria bacterium]